MSRNYVSEQLLIDQLFLSNTTAFEEIYRRYCHILYNYCHHKLESPEDAKRIVRDIFIDLWKNRQSLPIDFSLPAYLYTTVRKAVVSTLHEKLIDDRQARLEGQRLAQGFAMLKLRQACEPVQKNVNQRTVSQIRDYVIRQKSHKWVNYYWLINFKGITNSIRQIANLW